MLRSQPGDFGILHWSCGGCARRLLRELVWNWKLMGFEDVLNRVDCLYYKPKESPNVSEYLLLLSSGVLCSPRLDRGESES